MRESMITKDRLKKGESQIKIKLAIEGIVKVLKEKFREKLISRLF